MDEPRLRAVRFPALGHRDYRRAWLGATASAVAFWSLLMARAWIALDVSDSGFAVGVVTFAAMAPWMLAPIGGALADRFDRARVLVYAGAVQALLALGLAGLALADVVQVWQLVLFAFAGGLVWSVETPTQQALLPNTVGKNELLNAIALASLARYGSRLIGPVAATPMLSNLGPGWIFVMAAGFSLLAAFWNSRVRVRSTGGIEGSGRDLVLEAGAHVKEALRYVGGHRQVRMVMALVTLHCMLTMSIDAMLPIFAKRELDGGSGLFGALLMGLGGGALAGTLALAIVSNSQQRGALFLGSGLLSGVGVVVLGLGANVATAVAGAAIAGAAQAMFMTLAFTFIQSVVPDEIRGRVMSLAALFAGGVMAIMILANGTASDVISVRILLIGPAVLFIALLIAWSLGARELQALYRRGTVLQVAPPMHSAAG